MTDRLALLDAIAEHSDFHTAIFLTYGADLAFFEEAILQPLWQNECRNILVLLDDARYADTVTDLHGAPAFVGRRYLPLSIRFNPPYIFHPKLVLLLGHERGRLLVGSGNLTFTGFGQNHEVYTCLDWTHEEPSYLTLFQQAWILVRRVCKEWSHSDTAELMLKKAEYIANWLGETAETAADVELLHSLDGSLFDQLARRLQNKEVRDLTIVTPFLDAPARALERFYKQFRPSKLRLVVQNGKAVGDLRALERLKRANIPLKIFPFRDQHRYLHAKLYLFRTRNAAYLITGSANCTAAAWFTQPPGGNLEVVLLRAGKRAQFDYLLSNKVAPPLRTFDQLDFKARLEEPLQGIRALEVLDATLQNKTLKVHFRVLRLPSSVKGLALRFSNALQDWIVIDSWDQGENVFQVESERLLRWMLERPVSCFISGTDAQGRLVELVTNELWITNADLLHYEISNRAVVDPSTAELLRDGIIGDEKEWNDLYGALISLVELDIVALRRRGVTYSKRTGQEREKKGSKERETIIRETDETEEALRDREIIQDLYNDLPIAQWFDYVRGNLPVPHMAHDSENHEEEPKPEIVRPTQHRKPSFQVSDNFKRLVRRYIRALKNDEYMQTATVHHILSYYVIFQRIVWLLHEHDALTDVEYFELLSEMNISFFGEPEDMAPVRCPWLRHHVQQAWAKEWEESQALSFALASMVLGLRRWQAQEEERPEGLLKEVQRMLACLTVISGLDALRDSRHLFKPAAEVYGLDPAQLARQFESLLKKNLRQIATLLFDWQSQAIAGQGSKDGELPQRLAARATVDYGLCAYELARRLGDTDRLKAISTDLPFWLRQMDKNHEAEKLEDDLLVLITQDGSTKQIATTLYEQGVNLFHDRAYRSAESKLRRAIQLAEKNGEPDLASKAHRILGQVELFIRLGRQ